MLSGFNEMSSENVKLNVSLKQKLNRCPIKTVGKYQLTQFTSPSPIRELRMRILTVETNKKNLNNLFSPLNGGLLLCDRLV